MVYANCTARDLAQVLNECWCPWFIQWQGWPSVFEKLPSSGEERQVLDALFNNSVCYKSNMNSCSSQRASFFPNQRHHLAFLPKFCLPGRHEPHHGGHGFRAHESQYLSCNPVHKKCPLALTPASYHDFIFKTPSLTAVFVLGERIHWEDPQAQNSPCSVPWRSEGPRSRSCCPVKGKTLVFLLLIILVHTFKSS